MARSMWTDLKGWPLYTVKQKKQVAEYYEYKFIFYKLK